LQHQTLSQWELIVVDDGSIDNTSLIVHTMAEADQHLRLLHNTSSEGTGISRLMAANVATGQILTFIDSGDVWLSHRPDESLRFTKDNNYSGVHSSYRAILSSGLISSTILTREECQTVELCLAPSRLRFPPLMSLAR